MDTKEYLTEENYQKGKRALKLAAIIVLAISLVAGVTLITLGILTKTQGSRSASALSANDVLAVETEVPSSTEETSAKNRNSLHQEALEMWKEMNEETEAEVEAVRERNEATAKAAGAVSESVAEGIARGIKKGKS